MSCPSQKFTNFCGLCTFRGVCFINSVPGLDRESEVCTIYSVGIFRKAYKAIGFLLRFPISDSPLNSKHPLAFIIFHMQQTILTLRVVQGTTRIGFKVPKTTVAPGFLKAPNPLASDSNSDDYSGSIISSSSDILHNWEERVWVDDEEPFDLHDPSPRNPDGSLAIVAGAGAIDVDSSIPSGGDKLDIQVQPPEIGCCCGACLGSEAWKAHRRQKQCWLTDQASLPFFKHMIQLLTRQTSLQAQVDLDAYPASSDTKSIC